MLGSNSSWWEHSRLFLLNHCYTAASALPPYLIFISHILISRCVCVHPYFCCAWATGFFYIWFYGFVEFFLLWLFIFRIMFCFFWCPCSILVYPVSRTMVWASSLSQTFCFYLATLLNINSPRSWLAIDLVWVLPLFFITAAIQAWFSILILIWIVIIIFILNLKFFSQIIFFLFNSPHIIFSYTLPPIFYFIILLLLSYKIQGQTMEGNTNFICF